MADNHAVTKEDLQNTKADLLNALDNIVAQLTKLVQATKADLTAEMDHRFAESRNEMERRFAESRDEMNKGFRRADRQRQEMQGQIEGMQGQIHELRSKLDGGLDDIKAHAEKISEKYYNKLVTVVDGQVAIFSRLDLEQKTLGTLQDQLRTDHDESNKTNGVEIGNLKERVTKLEEEVFAEPTE